MYSFIEVLVTLASKYTDKRVLQALHPIAIATTTGRCCRTRARNSRNGRVGLSFSLGTA